MVFQATSHSFRDMSLPTTPGSVNLEGQWGMHIESALVVRKVRVSLFLLTLCSFMDIYSSPF